MPNEKRPDSVVNHGDVFHAFVSEAVSIGNEVDARRAFDKDVIEWLAERGLTEDFNAWRSAKQ